MSAFYSGQFLKNGNFVLKFRKFGFCDYIENNSTDPMSGHDTGSYDYTFEEVEEVCENGFVIGTTHYGCVNIDGNTLRLTEIHVDGPVYIFNR